MTTSTHAVWVAWLLTSVYYFYQYALRAAPAVMMPQLSHALNLNPVGIASLAAVFYYGYSPFSLVAGAAIDRFGAKTVVPLGALITGAGAILFGLGGLGEAATLIGATQMFGMAGGAAGQFLVAPMMARGLSWQSFWIALGIAGFLMAAALLLLIPAKEMGREPGTGIQKTFAGMADDAGPDGQNAARQDIPRLCADDGGPLCRIGHGHPCFRCACAGSTVVVYRRRGLRRAGRHRNWGVVLAVFAVICSQPAHGASANSDGTRL
jgi:Major Facilitator Superfamily